MNGAADARVSILALRSPKPGAVSGRATPKRARAPAGSWPRLATDIPSRARHEKHDERDLRTARGEKPIPAAGRSLLRLRPRESSGHSSFKRVRIAGETSARFCIRSDRPAERRKAGP